MDPNNPLNLRYRFIGEATEKEIEKTMRDPDLQSIEWETAGQTWHYSLANLVIIRAGAGGGDTRFVEGGFRYLTAKDLLADWDEIRRLIPAFKRRQGD